MRRILPFLFAFVTSSAQGQTPSAEAVLKPVLADAGRSGKKVLLIFHASWCGWCRTMDASLSDPIVKPLIDRYFNIAHLTVLETPAKKGEENPGAEELLNRFGGKEQGLPYWAVLDAKGELLYNSQFQPGKNTGCPANAEEVAYWLQVLEKTTTLTAAERQRIGARFRQNERQ